MEADRELVARAKAGDETAVRDLVGRYQGQVFGLCYRMLAHRQDAEDMAQETFVRAIKSLDRWDQSRDFEPWLFSIAGNRCRTLLAKRMRRPVTLPLVDSVASRDGELQAVRQLAEEVELALSAMREEYRQAFLLFHEQQLSYVQIGEVMDCPLGTVKTWVHRARREMINFMRLRGVVEGKENELPAIRSAAK